MTRLGERVLGAAIGLGALALLPACHPEDIDPLENQAKYKPYQESELFADGRSMRTPPAHTVAREEQLDESKPPLSAELIARGRQRYEITCAVCHGIAGEGRSMVGSKMNLITPVSFHDERLRAYTPDELYRVITEGYGVMPRYATLLDVHDRWAVAAYVKTLQRSQWLPFDEAPADVKTRLEVK